MCVPMLLGFAVLTYDACSDVDFSLQFCVVPPQTRSSCTAVVTPATSTHQDPRSLFCLQVYYCQPLALVFLEFVVVQQFHDHTHSSSVPLSLQPVLRRLSMLYGLWSLSQHTALLYQGETGT